MPLRNTTQRYGAVAILLHWTIAALIATNLGLGFYFANVMDEHDPGFFAIVQLHKSIGLTVLVLSLLRLAWRLVNPIPPLPVDLGLLMKFLARASHFLFYVLIIAVPLMGWAVVSTSPRGTPTLFFGFFQWPFLPVLSSLPRAAKREYVDLFETIHALLAYSALGLVVVHASAALWHQFVRRDDVLKRMLPFTRVSAP